MVSLGEGLVNAARAVYCGIAGPAAAGLSALAGVYEGFGGEEQGEDLRGSAQLFRNAQQVACNRPPTPLADEVGPPFDGGQCDTQYRVTGTFVGFGDREDAPAQPVDTLAFGPLSTVSLDNGTDLVDFQGGLVVVIEIFDETGGQRMENLNVERVDGNPDDCGNLPFESPRFNPGDWEGTQPVTYDDNNGSPVTVNPNFKFGPNKLGPGGGIRVPVKIDLGDGLEFDLDLDLTGDDSNFNPPEGEQPFNVLEPNEGPENDDGQESVDRIIGVRVYSSGPGPRNKATPVAQNSGPSPLYFPYIGLVSFLCKTEGGVTAWTQDYPVKHLNQVVWAPRNTVRVAVASEDDWNLNFRVIYSRVPCEECC